MDGGTQNQLENVQDKNGDAPSLVSVIKVRCTVLMYCSNTEGDSSDNNGKACKPQKISRITFRSDHWDAHQDRIV